ncbi:hypothetical protein RB195_002461 [Necator americanus]|uniref:Uncharacterized protein n=1 Tax=Necator americanus TaxID=51031 RepID=A0ABR1DJ53_NECAM
MIGWIILVALTRPSKEKGWAHEGCRKIAEAGSRKNMEDYDFVIVNGSDTGLTEGDGFQILHHRYETVNGKHWVLFGKSLVSMVAVILEYSSKKSAPSVILECNPTLQTLYGKRESVTDGSLKRNITFDCEEPSDSYRQYLVARSVNKIKNQKCFSSSDIAVWIAKRYPYQNSEVTEQRISRILVPVKYSDLYNQYGMLICGIAGFIVGEFAFLTVATVLARNVREKLSILATGRSEISKSPNPISL